MATCANCGAENPAGKRFCGDCGRPLAIRCSSCGAENPPEKKFCGDCGAPLGNNVPTPVARVPAAVESGIAERRFRRPAPQFGRRSSSSGRASVTTEIGELRDHSRRYSMKSSSESSAHCMSSNTMYTGSEWLVEQGRQDEAEPLLSEAREIFERLDAKPWVARAEGAEAGSRAEVSA